MVKLFITLLLIPQLLYAACNPKTDIVKTSTGWQYSNDCHIEVGKKIKQGEKYKEALAEAEKVIELKDLALTVQYDRVDMWQQTTFKMEDRLLKVERLNKTDHWIWFGIGIIVMGAATYGAGQLR